MADLPCPLCGSDLAFLEQYHRYYCHRCGQYAPEGYGEHGAKKCPSCGGILSYVTAYDRLYCYRCNTYAPPEPAPAITAAPAAAVPISSPTLAGETPSPGGPAPSEAAPPPTPAAASSPPPALATTPAETALVATPAPSPAMPTPEPAAKEEPPAEDQPAVPFMFQDTTPSVVATPEPVTEKAAEKTAEPPVKGPAPAIRALAASKPAVVRVKIFSLKKAELIDLCKAYDLEPSGTKEQLQERLLSYLHSLEVEEPEEEETPEATPSVPSLVVETKAEPETIREKAESVAAVPVPAAQITQALLIQEPKPEPAPQPASQPTPVVVPVPVPAPVVEVPKPAPKVGHPCPTCGRELTFIAQYSRWYCYSCQRYAPAARAKMACPTCGATMRWIELHQRWWCDACQKYAPADLPRLGRLPSVAAKPQVTAVVAPQVLARPVTKAHRHLSPASGIGLVGFGLALYMIVTFFADLAPMMKLAISNPFTAEMAALTRFFAFLFVAAGVIIGLSALRDRP